MSRFALLLSLLLLGAAPLAALTHDGDCEGDPGYELHLPDEFIMGTTHELTLKAPPAPLPS